MKRDEYPRHYIGPLRGRLSKNPVLFPHFLAFVLPRWPLGVKFQEQQQAGGATGAPAPAARARRCTSPGGRRGLLWVASAPRAGGGPAPTRPSPGTAGSGSRGRARQRAQLAAIALAKGKKIKKHHKKKTKPKTSKGTRGQLAASFRINGPGETQTKLGSRGEAEKDSGATTGALGHSDVSDGRAAADGSAWSRAVCAGSCAAASMRAAAPAFDWVALPAAAGQ